MIEKKRGKGGILYSGNAEKLICLEGQSGRPAPIDRVSRCCVCERDKVRPYSVKGVAPEAAPDAFRLYICDFIVRENGGKCRTLVFNSFVFKTSFKQITKNKIKLASRCHTHFLDFLSVSKY